MLIFTVFDKKTPVHKSQFFAESVTDAVRSFYRLANDSRSDVNLFPSDFALYRVGELDINTGRISSVEPIELVVDALSLIKVDKDKESN